jgi:hypothetical protein
VKVTVPGGCNATSTTTTCTVNANPTATISTPEGTNLCGLPDLDLVANAGAGYTYIWYKNGVIMAGVTTQTNTVTTVGDYRVKVTNASGCGKTSAIKTVIATCKEGVAIPEGDLFPNPTTGLVNIVYGSNSPDATELTITVVDMAGRQLYKNTVDLRMREYAGSLDLYDLAAGMYIVQFSDGFNQMQKQLVIAK